MVTRNESDLIIVPGHGVCKKGFTAPDVALLESSWVGIFPCEGRFYIEHIKEGVRLAAENPRVVFQNWIRSALTQSFHT